MTQATSSAAPGSYPSVGEFLPPEAFDELDAILDDLRSRYEETPQWEFCEGFMAALICSRRVIPAAEYLPVLLGLAENATDSGSPSAANDSTDLSDASEPEGSFSSPEQHARFMALWTARWDEVQTALDSEVQSLEDDNCYHPEVMDVRAAVAELSPEEQGSFQAGELPAFAQVWALGFMFAVESWPDEWSAPRDKDAAKWLDSALEAVVAMTEDDTGTPEVSPLTEDAEDGEEGDSELAPPTTSIARLNAFGEAIWAVYDLRELWRTMGPRVDTVRKEATPGRNDACPCGSGKKYKKCHGA